MGFFKIISLVSAVICLIISCKKDKSDTTPKTKTEYLTSKTWIYDEYYREYNTSPVLYYKRGQNNNLIDLSLNKVTYRTDGTYTETTETGTVLNGTWEFLNNESQVQVVNSMGTYTSTIITLNDQKYEWLAPTTSNGTFGKMIPQ